MSAPRGPLRKRNSNIWAREEHDHYVEDGWCSARLFEEEKFEGSVVDPSCGFGRIVASARAAGYYSWGSDIVQRTPAAAQYDFLDRTWPGAPKIVDNIVSNPPFDLCSDRETGRALYVEKALDMARCKVALLLPANWHVGDKRSRWLESTPLRRVLFLTPRPSMPPGHVIAAGEKPGNGTKDYAWFVWLRGYDGPWSGGWLRRDP